MTKININDFGLDSDDIPSAVEELFNKMSSLQISKLNIAHGSAFDFIRVLFHLNFVEKLSVSQIAEKLDLQPPNIKKHLYNFGWDYSQDYEKNKSLSEVQRIKKEEILNKLQSVSFDSEVHYELKSILMIGKNLRHDIYSKMNFKTGEEMARVLYYLVRVEGMSRKDIAAFFGMNIDTVRLRLESLGLSVDHEEGIKLKKIRGSQDYDKTNLSIKKTRLDSQIRQHSTGSKNEDVLRKKLSLFLYDYIGESYETVVGLSNTGILGGGKEIDIPIVVYQRNTQKVFRFAVEYNGAQYHNEQRDSKKRGLCESIGWCYLSVTEDSGNQLSNNKKLIEIEAHRLCEEIKMVVQKNE